MLRRWLNGGLWTTVLALTVATSGAFAQEGAGGTPPGQPPKETQPPPAQTTGAQQPQAPDEQPPQTEGQLEELRGRKPAVAVEDFRVIGGNIDPSAGEALASVVRSALIRGDDVRVVERDDWRNLLKKNNINVTDIIDAVTAIRYGRGAGVRWLITGTIAGAGPNVNVTCSMVDTDTGEAPEAEEFTVKDLSAYPRLGRLLASLITQQPIQPDSIALEPMMNECFDGSSCPLYLGMARNQIDRSALEGGQYIVERRTAGQRYPWIPNTPGMFYMQCDLAQLDGPMDSTIGFIWGGANPGNCLSMTISGAGEIVIEHLQSAGKEVLARRTNWRAVRRAPQFNQVRIESWGPRHRVFVNGELFDDFLEAGFENGKIGLGTFVPDESFARFAVDNMICGAIRPEMAGILPEGPAGRRVPPGRGPVVPTASIERIWLTHEVRSSGPGVEVHAAFKVSNCRGTECEAQFNFLHANTRQPIRDRDGKFASPAGNVAATRAFVPPRRYSMYQDMSIFVPYDQLHLLRHNARAMFNVSVWDVSDGQRLRLARSQDVEFWARR